MWDHVIIGAGTAGCVLAHELTASGRRQVLLVEAGGRPPLTVGMPAGMVKLFRSRQDWAYQSQPQAACNDRIVFTPRGRMLGGCANMNAQIHQWCHPADYDGWEALGARGWSWRDVAPVFRTMENWTGCTEGDQRRGTLGPMHIARPRRADPLAAAFVESARKIIGEGTRDYNGGDYRGAWLAELAHKDGRRFSVYDAYLKPSMKRANLAVRSGVLAEHILFEGRRAVGVRLRGGEEVRANHSVILSAGAFGTPQLLLRSGIGPAAHLRELGIAVRADRPEIGANLQDHPLSCLKFATRTQRTMKAAETVGQLLQWLLLRRGMLATNGVEAIAFTNVLGGEAPDLELLVASLEWRSQALEPPETHAYTIGVSPCAPRSRGTLRLRSADPDAPPLIDFALLSDPEGIDARLLLEGARLARRIAASEPLARETVGELPPGSAAQSDGELLDYLKSEIQTVYHPAGTCRMGDDEAAPADSKLKLRDFDGLWAVDASVMPALPRGHPNAVVAMIARRAAEWIAADALPAAAPVASRAVEVA